MGKKTIPELIQTGLDFFEFLKETERTSVKDRFQLKEIYNSEFRMRNQGITDANFCSVIYALKVSYKITVRKGNVNFKSSVTSLFVDQWSSPSPGPGPSPRRPRPVPNGASSPAFVQGTTSADEAETGVRARRRMASLLMNKLKTNRAEFIADKHGVLITSDPPADDGKLSVCVEASYEYVITLNVKNTGTKPVHFTYYTPLHWLKYITLSDQHKVTKANPLSLQPGDTYNVQVRFSCSSVGFFPATLAFEFKADLQTFHIVRFMEVQFMTALGRELAPVAPYRPRALPAWDPAAESSCEIVDGQRPEGQSVLQLELVVPLKKYKIPPYMNQLIALLKECPNFHDNRKNVLESPLSWEKYAEKFQMLLHLEELQMEVDIRRYNIPNQDREFVVMTKDPINKKLLIMEVPGVSENRPSVLRGDELLVCPAGEKGVKYRGYVHHVMQDRIKLGFSSKLLDVFVENMKFNVEFIINRLTLRIQHRAAEMAHAFRLQKVLFPAASDPSPLQTDPPKLRLFDMKLERNPEQYRAVQHIVAGSSKPAPYLVFGPPGTGKTVTLVEAIKQIEKTQDHCRILACAPSNSAADLLCTKILDHVDEFKVHRMYASSRDPATVPERLKACSNLVGDCYVFAHKEKLMKYKVIVTTLLTAGRLVSGGIPAGHFTHIFVDEAGHAVETECLVPLSGLLDVESGQVVLAGDPKQLGPILRSPFAQKYGLGVSLLERMMTQFSVYQKDEGVLNSRFVTKLLCNYRSHPAILKVPNELFYDGELQACADEILRNSYCGWEHLPKEAYSTGNFPVIFHGVTGRDEREASSPSFFNVAEVEVLMDYVRKLLQTHGKKRLATISPSDIGIIAPYRKQVQKIRKALEKIGKEFRYSNMNSLKVGSVEEFQGQERRVILVSTVRSSPDYVEMDKKFNLGFVKNEKRFNVAVTRAKALLIVVGNPVVLSADSTWAHFITYCKDEGGYTGFLPSEEDVDDVALRLSALYVTIQESFTLETAESAVQQHLHLEWRSDL
ncbi:putative helicase mov-10-B.1 [Betta splendens]|uniref:RNA helicase n=1 Tax=Betta splendens TaxID=158456 RepID=A0A6P7MY71_BETSP|nr:putative helicase mov-10-B.1 [Betta splendens]